METSIDNKLLTVLEIHGWPEAIHAQPNTRRSDELQLTGSSYWHSQLDINFYHHHLLEFQHFGSLPHEMEAFKCC